MGLANDMKKLREEILASYKKRAEGYQQRLKENEDLVLEVQKTLDGFRKSHLEMTANLRNNAETLRTNLNQGEIARLNAFSDLMSGIGESISTIQKEVQDIQKSIADLLIAYSESRSKMAEELNEQFTKEHAEREKQNQERIKQNKERLKDFDNLIKGIRKNINEMSTTLHKNLNTNQEERVALTRELLKKFQDQLTEIGAENSKMAKALRENLLQFRKDLSAGDKKRMEDFEQAMGKIRSRVTDIQNSIANLINNLSSERMQAASDWRNLTDAITQLKNNLFKDSKSGIPEEPASPMQDVSSIKKEPKEKNTVEKKTEEAVEIPEDMSLEDKIIVFVNAHPEGVKVSEMEEPLGEQRMRIGYVCKKLLEEEKLTKFENAYFPKAKGSETDN